MSDEATARLAVLDQTIPAARLDLRGIVDDFVDTLDANDGDAAKTVLATCPELIAMARKDPRLAAGLLTVAALELAEARRKART